MNPARFIHSVSVSRQSRDATNATTGLRDLTVATIYADLPCLLEGKQGSGQKSKVGRVSQGQFCMSWGGDSPDIREGDLVVVLDNGAAPAHLVGRQFYLTQIIDDTLRPNRRYFVADLAEKKG